MLMKEIHVILKNNVFFYENMDLDKFVVRMIGRLQCKVSMTQSLLSEVIDECEELMFYTHCNSKNKILEFLQNKEMLNDPEVTNFLQCFEFESPFHKLKSLDQQIDALKMNFKYIEPIDIPLGYRLDNVLDKDTNTYITKTVMESFQYVPIIKTLELILSNKEIREAILCEKKSRDEEILESFLDGEHFKSHPFFSEYPHAIRIQLYYDELEIVNPLGSKTGIHKLGGFYVSFQNLPPQINSELTSIHTLCLCTHEDFKKYGFHNILYPFTQDLLKLESPKGVVIKTEVGEFVLRTSLASFCGDGLAVHEIYNLLGPSAKKFCRMCLCDRSTLRSGIITSGPERTEYVYAQHLENLKKTNFSAEMMTETGMRGDSYLNSSLYFHTSRNKVFDPMHDLLYGICPMIIKLVLQEYVIHQRKFDVNYFNGKIKSFSYGFTENNNRPSANFTTSMLRKGDHSLSQKAMQMWCLIQSFPFLIYEKIEHGDKFFTMF